MRGMAVGLASVLLLAGCNIDPDFADDLVDKAAERNERRIVELQRQELPLPDPDEVEYKSMSAEDLQLDDDFIVNLVDDLVIGADGSSAEYLFVDFASQSAALGNVAVDGAGRLLVLETRSDEVRVFDTEGKFLFEFGRPGQGPADFQRPFGLAVIGDEVHVFHRRSSSSIWDLDGNFLVDREILLTADADAAAAAETGGARERQQRRFRTPLSVLGRPDGTLVMVFRQTNTEPRGRIAAAFELVLGRFEDGVETDRLAGVPQWAGFSYALSLDGDLYVGMFGHLRTEHYVVAYGPDGSPRWVLVSPWNPEIPPRADLRVDGEGRLFVFPNAAIPPDATRRPVRAYSRDGDLLGSGYLNRHPVWTNWQVIDRRHVYGVRQDPLTNEWEVVRYRIVIDAG